MRNDDRSGLAGVGLNMPKGVTMTPVWLGLEAKAGRSVKRVSPLSVVPGRDVERRPRAHHQERVEGGTQRSKKRPTQHQRMADIGSCATIVGLQVVLIRRKGIDPVRVAESPVVLIASEHREPVVERPADAGDELVLVEHTRR